MLDLIYLALTVALFWLLSFVARAVENLGPRAGTSIGRGTTGEERA